MIKYYYDYFGVDGAKFSYGATSWLGVDASLSYSSTYYDVYCFVAHIPGADWDGTTTFTIIDGYMESASLSLNSASPSWNVDGAIKSVAAHEFGHVLGLNENGHTTTIMNNYTWGYNSRYETYGIVKPQYDDIAGVNFLY